MKYETIVKFKDLQDDHVYEVGDEFPFDGRKVSKKRIAALAGEKNKRGVPLIKEAEE